MDSIEKAIRKALAKGDPGNRAFREAVYRSAFGALDRSIAANPDMTQSIAQRRRQTLLAAITAIETEFVPAKPASAAPQPVEAPQSAGRVSAAPAPVLDVERSPLAAERPARGGSRHGDDLPLKQRQKSPLRRKWGLVAATLGVVLVAGLGTAWWLAGPVTDGSTSSATLPQTGENTPPRLTSKVAALENWIDIFTPADPTTVAAPGDSRAEIMEGDDGQFLRIRSGASGTPVLFDIGQGVLERISGRRAVFSLTARGADGQSTQIAIDCSLDELGDCGRKRYDAGASREEFLFEIDLPEARVTAGGTVAINPDLEGAGKALDIYAIRILPGQ